MLCDNCKKNDATYFSTININGIVTEKHLCDNCAKASGELNFKSFFSPISNIFEPSFETNELTCNNCGYTLSEYLNSGFLGCSECYNVFNDYILKSLPKIQNGVKHVGKEPEKIEVNDSINKIKKLEQKLKQAVKEENYEEASVIKKEINKLKEAEDGNK